MLLVHMYLLKVNELLHFQLELLPDPAQNQGERKTSVSHGTNSPRFDEIFGFCVPEPALGNHGDFMYFS